MLENTWLLLIHQIPAKPSYFRAKIWRRLQQIGAVAIKQAAYVMPCNRNAREALEWVAKEIMESGGEAVLVECTFLAGLDDEQIIGLFRKTREADYQKILQEAHETMGLWNASEGNESARLDCREKLAKLRNSFLAIKEIDFFPHTAQKQVEAYLADMETIFFREPPLLQPLQKQDKNSLLNKTWVTRSNIYVDRMASAWFIRRFIDKNAVFKFINASNYQARENEIRFDMMDAEYTHQNDLCTFEVLIQTFEPEDQPLKQLGRVIHEIDLRDNTFTMQETPGIKALFEGIVAAISDDMERIEQASAMLDRLLVYFQRQI